MKEGEQVTDAIAKSEMAARADLEKKMQALIGASGIKGVPEPGKLNLESLIIGDMGFGMLEGLKYDLKGGTELLVTTRSLVERWLKAEQEIWKDRPGYAFGTEIGPALRTRTSTRRRWRTAPQWCAMRTCPRRREPSRC